MALTKVGPKYQVTIPKETREAVGLVVSPFDRSWPLSALGRSGGVSKAVV